MKTHLLLLALLPGLVIAADLPPDKGNEIPESAKRPVVVQLDKSQISNLTSQIPKADLPEGYTLSIAAAAPLVLHPIMGCLDDQGRLFMGDGVGVNWNKAQLEANPPNRVLMLEDTDNDGSFDKSTVFADKMTFPQGAAWLDGSLYVCSPPGLWKLTDTNNDGVADQREMIVSGFDYTGNAADVHGPFLHPNGRLYWCHGRKGHKATDRDGKVVHEGLACGIWSCKPDGRNLQWHALGCGDNPVEVDFTPDGDIIGVQNLYYTNPRGDTLVHWLYGGVYERSDQLKAIEGLPRTLEHMPVMYNFGHVAVSGSCFWKSYGSAPLQFMVTHFNTQRVVRMELTPDGSTYKATENEFLKLHSPDIHFTDVMEDPRDGSLLVVDTGGWFRIGCPSSLMAKPDIAGAIYRVKGKVGDSTHQTKPLAVTVDESTLVESLRSDDLLRVRKACEFITTDHSSITDALFMQVVGELTKVLNKTLDDSAEHAAIIAWQRLRNTSLPIHNKRIEGWSDKAVNIGDLRTLRGEIYRQASSGNSLGLVSQALKTVTSTQNPKALALALDVLIRDQSNDRFSKTLGDEILKLNANALMKTTVLKTLVSAFASQPQTSKLIAHILQSGSPELKTTVLEGLIASTSLKGDESWLPILDSMLDPRSDGIQPSGSADGKMPPLLVIDAIKKLKTSHFDAKLQAIANDAKQPQSLRLKALDAMSSRKITGETFTMVFDVLTKPESSAAAKIQAAEMMAHSGHTKEERMLLAKAFATVGPIELKSLLALIRPCKEEDILRAMAVELAKNPALISQQESIYRSALADKPTDIFEKIIHPAYAKAYEAIDAKKRTLGPLADKVIASGDAKAGKVVFESGKGTCIACHQIGDKGRTIGPNLSHIGGIRTERDLLESILFPSNTLARDYEAHIIETSAGETIMGVIRSHTAEGLLVVDVAGQEKNIPQTQMVSDTTLTTSLMPMGLDTTLPEKDLVDLVAYLRSLK